MASFVSETSDARGQTGAPRSPSGEVGAPGAVAACFEVRSRNIFLTYSKCHLDPVFMQEHLSSLLRRFEPTYVYVAREEHQDGSYHLHCLVQCKKYVRTKSAKFFDVEEFHPNVQNARMPHKVLAYIKKNPLCFVETGVFQASTKQKKKKVDAPSTKDAKMAEIIKSSTCKEDYLSMVRNTFPFDWATRLQQFQYSAESLFPSVPTPYMDPFGMPAQDEHPVIGAWLQAELFSRRPDERRRSLYICGPTRTGKTSWARSLGAHNYWQHSVDFLNLVANATYNVIDDIPFKFVPCWKGLVGCQFDITVNPKYGKRRMLKNGVPSIILVNEDEDWLKQMQPSQVGWFETNCIIHYMYAGESFFEA
ncbi:Rep [Bromus catharticus striate mosaic virus]|uniref:Replication-associated protein n=1 Tax=Bromus catharticus striate mosaic virus TaxID=936005 RepID=E7D4Y2_9GEMI|nr:Rep [Bromus catharticus striate mosaic virus]ADT91305.1 Rep [Bromus catharticus striate mosaic virus]